MHIVRTVLWMLITAVVVGFIFLNWGMPQPVKFWPANENGPMLVEWPVGFIALVFFLLGLVPMWLIHRGSKWRLQRRISNLETAARNAAIAASQPAPSMTPEAQPVAGPLAPAEPVDGTPKPKDEILK